MAESHHIVSPSDVESYGVRAYVTVKIGDNTVVIWQSEDEGNMPPLHLYIERRIVFLHSMYAAAKEGNAGSVNPPAVYTGGVLTGKHVYTTGDSALTANQAELILLLQKNLWIRIAL